MTSNDVLGSPRWTAIYRAEKYPNQEVIVNCVEVPTRRRTFRVPHVGRARFNLVGSTKLTEPEGGFKQMAPRSKKSERTKAKSRRRTKKQEVEEEDDEELEGLEDLDDDLEDLEEEEPDEVDEDEEDEEDDDEDEEEEVEEKKTRRKRTRKSSSSKKSSGRKRQAPPTRELPKGKHGAEAIAEEAGVDARAVRVFLRKPANKKKYPKDKETGRYAFSMREVKAIAKAIKASD